MKKINKKENLLRNIEVLIGSLIISIIITCFYYSKNIFGVDDKYREFIWGDTLFLEYNKFVDTRMILILISLFLCSFFIMKKVLKPKELDFKNMNINTNILMFLVLIIPIIVFMKNKNIVINNLWNYLLGYLAYVLLIYNSIFGKEKLGENKKNIILCIIFSYFSSVILKYIFIRYLNLEINEFIFMIGILSLSMTKINSYGIYISQIFLPLFFIKLLENKYSYNGELIFIQNQNSLKILVICLILMSYIYNLIDNRKNKNENKNILFSSIMVMMFLIIWNNVPSIYNLDEYHIGEIFTNFDQIINHGQIPYMQYIPVKGYFHLIIGFINYIFYGGGYASIDKAYQLNNLLSMIPVLFILNSILKKKFVALIILLNVLPFPGNYFLVVPAIYFMTRNKIIEDEYNFIIAYLYLCFFSFMYYQSFGIAIGIGLFPMIIIKAYNIYNKKIYIQKKHAYYVIPGIFIFIFNIREIFFGIKYSLINASSNTLYWGNQSIYLAQNGIYSILQMLKYHSWIIFVIIGIIYLIKNYKYMLEKDKLTCIFIIFFSFTVLTYITGRLDGNMARPYTFSYFIVNALLILCLYKYEKENSKLKLLSLSAMLSFYFLFTNFLPNIDMQKLEFETVHSIPQEMIMVDQMDYIKLGNGFIDRNRYKDLINEKKLFDFVCESEDDTFLIVDPYTTDSARYSLFGYKIPTLSHSVLNMPSINAQKWELERLRTFNVPITRISSGLNRYYMFHKEFLNEGYVYTQYNKREYLIKKEIFGKVKEKFNLEKLDISDSYSLRNAGLLPIKWGNSFDSNKEDVEKYTVELTLDSSNNIIVENKYNFIKDKSDPYIVYKLNNYNINEPVDFIKLNMDFDTKNENFVQMQIFWKNDNTDFKEENSIIFNARNGNLIIPVGLNLNWRNMKDINSLRIDVDGLDVEEQFIIDDVEFLCLKN